MITQNLLNVTKVTKLVGLNRNFCYRTHAENIYDENSLLTTLLISLNFPQCHKSICAKKWPVDLCTWPKWVSNYILRPFWSFSNDLDLGLNGLTSPYLQKIEKRWPHSISNLGQKRYHFCSFRPTIITIKKYIKNPTENIFRPTSYLLPLLN